MKPSALQHDPKLHQALLDVRKAYRLLYNYQRMIMDSAGHIGRQLDMPFEGGWPHFSDAARTEKRVRLKDWAWDWLNMVFYDFHFVKNLPDDKKLRLSVMFISDDGYFLAEDGRLDPQDVLGYLDVGRSSSHIAFVMSASGWDTDFTKNKEEMKKFIETGRELPKDYAGLGMAAKCFDLACIADEDSMGHLLDDVVAFANMSGIPLQRIAAKPKSD